MARGSHAAGSGTMTPCIWRLSVVSWDESLQSDLSLAPDRYDFNGTPPVLPGKDGIYPCAIPGVTRVL
jgi:hypothetical protein